MRDSGWAIAHSSPQCLKLPLTIWVSTDPCIPLLLRSSQHPYAYILLASLEESVSNAKLKGFLDTCYNCFHQILQFFFPNSWTYCSKESFLSFPISPTTTKESQACDPLGGKFSTHLTAVQFCTPLPAPQMLDQVLTPSSCLALQQQ